MSAPAPVQPRPPGLAKAATGIAGLDEVTFGGLPQGRPTLRCGGAGSGKTMIAFEFLARGAVQFGEPGVFVSFEETAAEIADKVRSLGYDVAARVAGGRLALDHARVERSEIEETGEYDLEGLSIRLEHAVARVGARRLVFDTIEALFAGLPDHVILRAELRRLFRWTKARGLTTLITGERGDGKLTRYGLEKYRADCAIVLNHRVTEQVSTRRLRVARYRGSAHGTNEYPFLIGDHGVSVLPITSLRLDQAAPAARGHLRRRARRHAGRAGLLLRRQRKAVRLGRHRQEQPALHGGRRRLPPRRACAALCFRGVGAADAAQQALDRRRSAALAGQRAAAHPGPASHLPGVRAAPADRARGRGPLRPRAGADRPHQQAHGRCPPGRGQAAADAADRPAQAARHHRALHLPDRRTRPGRGRRPAAGRVVADGYLAAAAQPGIRPLLPPQPVCAEVARHGAFQPGARLAAGPAGRAGRAASAHGALLIRHRHGDTETTGAFA